MRKSLPKSVQSKLRLLKKALQHGTSVSEACRQAGIARVTYYRWQKRQAKSLPRYKKLKSLKQKGQVLLERKLLKLVVTHPNLSCKELAQRFGKSQTFVWKILRKYSLGTRKQRKKQTRRLKIYPLRKQKYLETFGARVILLQRAQKRKNISYTCREFGVSRTLFYKWKKCQLGGEPLANREWKVLRWGRQISVEYERLILKLVARHPELSVHRLFQSLPKVAGVPVVGHHGVQNILRRNGLNTFDRRLEYARLHAPATQVQPAISWLNRLKSIFETFVPQVAPAPPPAFKERVSVFFKPFLLALFSTATISLLLVFWFSMMASQPSEIRFGLFFASIALLVGMFFFIYSMKYYFTLALVLSFSTQTGPASPEASRGKGDGNGRWLGRIFGLGNGHSSGLAGSGLNGNEQKVPAGGLQPNLDYIKLSRYPFISIHLPFYNEKKVVQRILSACTSFDYPAFEVIICDDSNDETVQIVKEWAKHPQVKVLHRPTREGFKGGALSYALKAMDPRTEFVVVFDADFVPYPDTLIQFMKYFKATGGWEEQTHYQAAPIQTMPYETFAQAEISNQEQELLDQQASQLREKSNTAVVAGYQWHVLNKSENWITRGVRTEYAGSYVIERPGQEIINALKIIHGSVYCIRADVLKHFGWGTSITEDFELTLRIYEQGFKVIYTPYIQAPSECVSTIKRLIRQRMRWAEGHSFNVRKMFTRLLFGSFRRSNLKGGSTSPGKVWQPSPLTLTEKLEFLYISPYYLQAFFFLLGTLSWLISETVFQARLPFWTSLWGWSLVLTNFFALPLMNAVGLFLEESEEKDYLGIVSFVILSYIVVPFQAYAALKGFLEQKEGPWFRTPKSGLITDILTRGRFYRWITRILPGRFVPALHINVARMADIRMYSDLNSYKLASSNSYLALATANNQFHSFRIRPRKFRFLGNLFLVFLLISSTLLFTLAPTIDRGTGLLPSSQVHAQEITTPVDVRAPSGPAVTIGSNQGKFNLGESPMIDYIFHKEPRVRVKLDGQELEFRTEKIEKKKASPKKAFIENQRATYQDIVPGVDLIYEVSQRGLSEKFLLKKPLAIREIEQSLIPKELIPKEEEGTIVFYNTQEEKIFSFDQPSMYEQDKPEMIHRGLRLVLEKDKLGFKLKKVLTEEGKAWLADPGRIYPVIIDPTVLNNTDISIPQPNNNLSAAVAPWNWQSVASDYTVKFKNDVTAGEIVEFSKQSKTLTFQPMALNWTNNLDQIQQIAIPQNTATSLPTSQKMRWENAYGTDRHLEFIPQDLELTKNLIFQNASALPSPSQTIINGGNPQLEFNFIFAYDDKTIDAYINGALWNKRTQTDTQDEIDFVDSTSGEKLWWFAKTKAKDNNNSTIFGSARLKKQGNSFYVSVLIPYSFLQTATFPVTIDPTVINMTTGVLGTSNSNKRHIVKTSDGTYHVIVFIGSSTATCGGQSKSGLLWFTSTNQTTWTCQDQLTSATSYASLVADSSDNLYALYSDNMAAGTGNALDVFYRKFTYNGGSSWTMQAAQTVLDGDTGVDGYAMAVLEVEGTTRLWLAARYFDNTNYQVVTYYSDGFGNSPTWSSSATLDTANTTSNAHIPTIVRYGTNIGVIYSQPTGTNELRWRNRADSDGLTSWNTEAAVADVASTPGPDFSATVDSSSNIHLAARVGATIVFTYYNGSSWSSLVTLASSNASGNTAVTITTDGTDVWVLWGDRTGYTTLSSTATARIVSSKGVSPWTATDWGSATAMVSSDRIYNQSWSYISSSYTDDTTDVGDTGTADVAMPSGVGDIIYFGMSETFNIVNWDLSTNGSGGVITWEYYNGSTWATLTTQNSTAPNFTADGGIYFAVPTDWAKVQVNTDASPGFYYVRARVTTGYTTTPVGSFFAAIPGRHNVSSIATLASDMSVIWSETMASNSPGSIMYATVPENIWLLLFGLPFLRKFLKRLRRPACRQAGKR